MAEKRRRGFDMSVNKGERKEGVALISVLTRGERKEGVALIYQLTRGEREVVALICPLTTTG